MSFVMDNQISGRRIQEVDKQPQQQHGREPGTGPSQTMPDVGIIHVEGAQHDYDGYDTKQQKAVAVFIFHIGLIG